MFDLLLGLMEWAGAFGLFLLMILENLFPPIPSELIVPLAGFLAAQGEMSFWQVILAGVAGSVVGAVFWYYVGMMIGRARILRFVDRFGPILTLSREDTISAFTWFERWGVWAVLVTRLIPGARTLISVPAGISRMPLPLFLLATTAGSTVWITILTMTGVLLRENYHRIESVLDPLSLVIFGGVAVVYFWRLLRQMRSRR